ncbi:hypothetical protein ABRZ68_21970, partial [Vibrio vulnificus]
MNNSYNKAFKSDSQRLAFSLRSSIAKRHSHLNAALGEKEFTQNMKTVLKSLMLVVSIVSALGCQDKSEVYANPPG